MNIIIVGCGKVGQTLIEQLNTNENNVTIVDLSEDKIKEIRKKYDVMDVVGNGATLNTLEEAGISKADLMIAVTNSDELNLLCCIIAKKAGNIQTIARVRSPEYRKDLQYLQEELDIALIINPEYEAAVEIERVLRFPSAIKIDTFAKGKIELLKFKVTEKSNLDDLMVKDISNRLHCNVLICMIQRGNEIYIPNGNSKIQNGDVLSIISSHEEAINFFKKVNLFTQRKKSAILIGGGEIAVYLAQILTSSGVAVKIIERNPKRCDQLVDLLPKCTIVQGDASDRQTLLEERIDQSDAIVCLTNIDEENIFLSLYAKNNNSKAKVVTKVTRIEFDDIVSKLELDSMVNPKYITAEIIVQFVRALRNSQGSNVERLYSLIKDKVEASEFLIKAESAITNRPLLQLKFKKNVLIAGILRDGKMIIPRGQDEIKLGDRVVVVSRIIGLHDITDLLL